jgi:hypothetical protein
VRVRPTTEAAKRFVRNWERFLENPSCRYAQRDMEEHIAEVVVLMDSGNEDTPMCMNKKPIRSNPDNRCGRELACPRCDRDEFCDE